MKCLLLMFFSHDKNYYHANVPLLAVPMQNSVNIDWYPNSLIAPINPANSTSTVILVGESSITIKQNIDLQNLRKVLIFNAQPWKYQDSSP